MKYKYTFDPKIPYEFKDVTGLSKEDNIGQSLLEDGKVIGGIISYKDNFVLLGVPLKVVTICAIEIIPEYRNKGIATSIIKDILTQCDCISAAVQDEKAWDWWKKMGAKEYMAVVFPEDIGKESPRAHTLAFVLGKNEIQTMVFKAYFQKVSREQKGAFWSKDIPKIDFSSNKTMLKNNENDKTSV